MEVFRCFLTWPEPYSSVCRDLLSTLSLELKAPGKHSVHHEAICVLNCWISNLICPLVASYRGAHDAPKCDYSHAFWSPSKVPQAAIFTDTHVFNRFNIKLLYVPRFFCSSKKHPGQTNNVFPSFTSLTGISFQRLVREEQGLITSSQGSKTM